MSTITTPEVQNMAGCRCAEYGSAMNDEGPADNPAFFVDERLWDAAGGDDQLDALMAGSLLRALQDAATRAGVPFARITERRWSERGVPIAPQLEGRSCENDRVPDPPPTGVGLDWKRCAAYG